MESRERREQVLLAGKAIHEAFVKYDENFIRMTRRAKRRFETRDWRGSQRDLAERIELYTKAVDRTIAGLCRELPGLPDDRALWQDVRRGFGDRVSGIPDGAFCKTFFNSIARRIYKTIGADPETEFVDIRFNYLDAQRHKINYRSYLNWGSVETIVEELLAEFPFDVPYANRARDIALVAAEIGRQVAAAGGSELLRLEFLPSVFYQSTRAYLVGQVFWSTRSAPLVIALRNDEAGIEVDAVLTSPDDVSILFGFTRSYFSVDIEPVEGAVYFINSILPHKPIDELYTVLGRVRQGKTERSRLFSQHLAACSDRFVHAPGDRGLVMIVFTLPSYDLVFKVIRDRFGYPKNTTREEVMERYQFVFNHDRAGRLIDTQEFEHVGFPVKKFDQAVLDELLNEAGSTVRQVGNQLVIDHLYIERRIKPLNLFIRDANRKAAERAVIDYGQAIKDLARTNVFPGDLLLKNFGVTRHGRVIFYDYDELCLVTDCRFRELPDAEFDEDEMRPQPWFYVDRHDIFPAEFIRFLAMDEELKAAFLAAHGDLLGPDFWRDIQAQHLSAKVPEVVPYTHSKSLSAANRRSSATPQPHGGTTAHR
jgi:isocitrate dehydrogenase kinase/phosphatase